MLRRTAMGMAVVALTVFGAAAKDRGEPKPGFNLFSKQQDIQLGQEAAAQVRQQYQEVQNPFLQNYLRQVGERLAATPQARNSGFPFRFTLLNSSEVNAFALPGGPMFVFTGLIKSVDTEGELAGVMAHEMSHVILRHGTNQVSKANLIQLPAMLAGVAMGGTMLGQLAQLGVGLGANSLILKFSRNDESQADELGARLMAEAGYNPIELARFFEKLEQKGGPGVPQFLSDHPSTPNRVRDVEDTIRTFPQASYGFSTGQFEEARRLIGGLPAAARRGQSSSYAAPQETAPASGGWRQFRGSSFGVTYPGNWQAWGGDSSSITLAPRDGLVQANNGTAVGLGAILSYFFPDQGRSDVDTETNDLIHHLRSQNPYMQVSSRPRRARVGGVEGRLTMLQSSSPWGGGETDALVTASRPEGLFYMVFVAPQRSYSGLQGTFQQMLDSLRFAQ